MSSNGYHRQSGAAATRAEADAGLDGEEELVIRNLDTGQMVAVGEALRNVVTIDTPDEGGGASAESLAEAKKRSGYGKLDEKRSSTEIVRVHAKNEVGDIVGPSGHKASVLANSLQLGIRYCVSRTESRAQQQRGGGGMLQMDIGPPYREAQKVAFPKEGSATTPRHDMGSFKFKEYIPTVFRSLRGTFQVDTADYLVSLCHTLPDGTNALRIMGTPGKSGSLFFFSHDMRFIVKTLPKAEAQQLRAIIEQYVEYIEDNPGSMLPRFYGLYRYMPAFGTAVRFLVMNNIFASKLEIHLRYDLKGSTLGRRTNLEERIRQGQKAVLKDLDLLQNNDKISVGKQVKQKLIAQITKDAELLARLNIMDYSLLVGVHNKSLAAATADPTTSPTQASEFLVLPGISRGHEREVGESAYNEEEAIVVKDLDSDRVLTFAPISTSNVLTRFDGQDGNVVYFLGIIDILTSYDMRKAIERGLKKEGASVLPPQQYGARFARFIEQVLE